MNASTPSTRLCPRDRLLAAANELFYEEGVHSVGIDRVIQRAGVAKASLYSSFGSKEGLVRAYLEARHAARRERVETYLSQFSTPREQILGIFDLLGDIFQNPQFRGCAFVNASAESEPGSAVQDACDSYRGWLRTLMIDLARQSGAADPAALASRLVLLYDGATVSASMDHDPGAAQAARAMAEVLLEPVTHVAERPA